MARINTPDEIESNIPARRKRRDEWLNNFSMMGIKLNEGEKSLMSFAMKKEREEIIKLWHEENACECEDAFNHLRERIEEENK